MRGRTREMWSTGRRWVQEVWGGGRPSPQLRRWCCGCRFGPSERGRPAGSAHQHPPPRHCRRRRRRHRRPRCRPDRRLLHRHSTGVLAASPGGGFKPAKFQALRQREGDSAAASSSAAAQLSSGGVCALPQHPHQAHDRPNSHCWRRSRRRYRRRRCCPAPAVAIGDAATRGGASHLWRRLRHQCWTVDVPELTTSSRWGARWSRVPPSGWLPRGDTCTEAHSLLFLSEHCRS